MEQALTDEQRDLRAAVRAFLADVSTSADARRAIETEDGFDRGTWRRLAAELGLVGIAIPERHGGSGGGPVELAIVLEEMGAALLCAPYFATGALAAQLLVASADATAMADLLPGIAAGSTIATASLGPGLGPWDGAVSVRAVPAGDGHALEGELTAVIDGHVADLVLLAAATPDGPTLFAVCGDDPGLRRSRLASLDLTRPLARIQLHGARGRLIGRRGGAAPALARASDLAAVALAAEQVGGSRRCLEMAVDHAKVRVQFGRAIGSFQAVKHTCADMLVDVESARSAAERAARTAAAGDDELGIVASSAASFCSDAYVRVATHMLQVHGGIGFTWDHDAHLYVRRAKASQLMLGSPVHHRQRVAALISRSGESL